MDGGGVSVVGWPMWSCHTPFPLCTGFIYCAAAECQAVQCTDQRSMILDLSENERYGNWDDCHKAISIQGLFLGVDMASDCLEVIFLIFGAPFPRGIHCPRHVQHRCATFFHSSKFIFLASESSFYIICKVHAPYWWLIRNGICGLKVIHIDGNNKYAHYSYC